MVSTNFTGFYRNENEFFFRFSSFVDSLFVWFFVLLFYWAHFICSSSKMHCVCVCVGWFFYFQFLNSFDHTRYTGKRNWAIEQFNRFGNVEVQNRVRSIVIRVLLAYWNMHRYWYAVRRCRLELHFCSCAEWISCSLFTYLDWCLLHLWLEQHVSMTNVVRALQSLAVAVTHVSHTSMSMRQSYVCCDVNDRFLLFFSCLLLLWFSHWIPRHFHWKSRYLCFLFAIISHSECHFYYLSPNDLSYGMHFDPVQFAA